MKNRSILLLVLLTLSLTQSEITDVTNELVILLISQPHIYFLSQIHNASSLISPFVPLLYTHSFDSSVVNSFTISPIFPSILHQYPQMKWLIIGEARTRFQLNELLKYLQSQTNRSIYLGHGLYDSEPSIIHHYSLDIENPYPDFGTGLVISRDILIKLTDRLTKHKKNIDFIIDVKYELNRMINELVEIKLDDRPDLFCYENRSTCLTSIDSSVNEFSCERKSIGIDNLYFGIKTFVDFHSSRIPLLKKTWLNSRLKYHLFTNVNDKSHDRLISTNENTERGHCHKTFFIFNHFYEFQPNEEFLIVADDDTLLSIRRVLQAIRCLLLSNDFPLVLGERYAYDKFYSYPTGGSSMIFNRQAIQQIISNCRCPSADTPDDMFIGMCLKRLEIPLIHLSELHQAQPSAYAKDWLKHQKSISFHKFDGIDVEKIYRDFLEPDEPKHRPIDEF